MGSWLVQPSLNTVSRNGTSAQLEPKVMAVLVCLAEHAPEPVSKEKLLQAVWPDTFVGEGVLTRSVFELRRIFGDEAKEAKVIQTIAKRGYRLVEPVVPNGSAPRTPGNGTAPVADLHTQPKPDHRTMRLGILVGLGMAALLVAILGFAPNKWWQRLRGLTGPEIRSLAVLPLQNLSGDVSQDYFADGMTEELITELSRLSSVRVISRTSIMRYKNANKPLPEIARELGVEGIIAGSVLRSGDQVRITAQLIYAPQDKNIWAQSYERDVKDVLALQSAVASSIASEIRVQMKPGEQAQLNSSRTVNLKAHEAYLQGR